MEKISCRERLKQLRKEIGYKHEDPDYSNLPVIHLKAEKVPKHVKKSIKKERAKKAQYVLYEVFTKAYRKEILSSFEDVDDLIDFCIDWFDSWREQCCREVITYDLPKDIETEFDPEFDIPPEQEKEYHKYLKGKKLKGAGDIFKYRQKFINKVNKSRKKYYKKGLMVYDPLFKHSRIDEKQMVKNLKRISAENERRVQEFQKMMEKLVGDDHATPEICKRFSERAEEVKHRARQHLKDVLKTSKSVPLPFTISD